MLTRGSIIAAVAATLAGCTSSHMTTERLPDGRVIANVYSSRQDLTIAAASISTYECKRSGCKHVTTGGGVSNGGSGIIGPTLGVAAAAVAPTSGGIAIMNGAATAISASKSKAGSGNSAVNVGVTSTNVNVNGNSANAQNFNQH